MIKWPRGGNERTTESGTTCHAFAERRIQTVEQERLIVIHLHIGAKAVVRERPARTHIEYPSLLGVDLDEWLCTRHHHGPSARIQQSNVLVCTRWPMVTDKHAGVIRRVAIQDGSAKVDGLARCANRNRSKDVVFAWRNIHPAGLRHTAGFVGTKRAAIEAS